MMNLSLARWVRPSIIVLLAATLSGCGDNGVQEVKEWMADVKAHTHAFIPKLTAPKKFIPFVYDGNIGVDPFNPNKLLVVLAKLQASSTGLKPNFDRRREALENYPLDTVRMVGILQKVGLSYALLQIDKTVFPVKVGNYVGQNFGMVTHISETEINIKEIVQDASGEWVERQAKLALQESTK
ncbi:pilus assembly protein PilP [Glaciimonas immobilis]|uniref:Type IV pilus assembly protein PilP n=1 Tax=Glaciimonas immobilis TaxID=728004 RepID=A0A840RSX9_9BURK|nr:pilus assembly protein PilP [Glaciimonas immobilis]KAF3998731.1 pilus assembly protein PilP [Glaciimonas immobilis]MBB5201617.1 type IV pilus assembly protein PilP [Glaciimonas immobilis]